MSSKLLTPPAPRRPGSVYPPPPPWVWGEDTLAGWKGGWGVYFLKTQDTALYSTYVSTLWMGPTRLLSSVQLSCHLLYHPILWTAGLQKHNVYYYRGPCPLNLKIPGWRQFSRFSSSFLQFFPCQYSMLTLNLAKPDFKFVTFAPQSTYIRRVQSCV